jgi:hypothetical protein
MRTFLLAAVLAIGCSKDASMNGSPPSPAVHAIDIASISIDQLDTMLASGACQAVDANGAGTRKKLGVIPGAVLLTDSDTYDLEELPVDKTKPLVFYCANTKIRPSRWCSIAPTPTAVRLMMPRARQSRRATPTSRCFPMESRAG